MTIKIGEKIPDVTIQRMGPKGPEPVKTQAALAGRKVVLFAVPGAFTPTCSARHLPGFVQHADEIRAKGVTLIACMAVNDAFVMHAWGKDQKVGDKILMLADGSGVFTKALGLELDATGFGMGLRSQRFAMILEDLVLRQLFIDAPGAFEVSSAEHVLKHL